MTRIKGQLTTADYFAFTEYLRLLQELHQDGLYQWEAYCKISFFTALRVSDVRSTRWMDLLGKDEMIKVEKKTQKRRVIKINEEIRDDIMWMYELLGRPDPSLSVICNPRTKEPYSREYINRKLKWFRWRYRLKIKAFSTHSFRKTFGRYVYESKGRTAEALLLLNQILLHKNMDTTRRYIGLVQEDVVGVYNSLTFHQPKLRNMPPATMSVHHP